MSNEHTLLATNWNDLKYFLALKRHGRLSLTARALGTTHVTVGNRIAALEQSLGTQLFFQTAGGFQLTKAGDRFSRYAEELEHYLRLGMESTTGAHATRPKVRIGVTEGLGDNYLSTRIGAWMTEENLEIDFLSLPKSTTVASREADISITLEQPESEFVIRRVLTDYTLGIYASRDYLARHGPVRNRAALITHRWIGYIESLMFTEELKYHHEIAPDLDFVFQSTSIRAQLQAARAGAGLSILPDYMARDDDRLERVLPRIHFLRHYWISTNRDLHRFRAVNRTWNFLLKRCRRDRTLLHSRAASTSG